MGEVLWTENMTEQVNHSGNESETLLQNGHYPWFNPFCLFGIFCWNPNSQSPHTCKSCANNAFVCGLTEVCDGNECCVDIPCDQATPCPADFRHLQCNQHLHKCV